ncbi:MAG: OsmC family protein [Bryobacteraceae bacterium]|nr:OsmC family protein [Bryobacteraceae bacterium]
MRMEVSVQHLGGVQFEATARGHRIVCDQPEDNQGFDEGMTPPELLLSSLATCAAFYAAQYLKTRGLGGAGLQVRVTAEKAKQPARIGSFQIQVQVPGLEDERHREGVLRAVHACVIHNTLLHAPAIEVNVERLEAVEV